MACDVRVIHIAYPEFDRPRPTFNASVGSMFRIFYLNPTFVVRRLTCRTCPFAVVGWVAVVEWRFFATAAGGGGRLASTFFAINETGREGGWALLAGGTVDFFTG